MADELSWGEVQRYLAGLVPERPAELARMEADAARDGFPILGPVAGHLCYQVARLIGARRVFELGSGFGYSTAWLARAVQENGGGRVHHVVWDSELSARARDHLTRLGLGDVVRFKVGEAVAVLRETKGPFDLILVDIDKEAYPAALDAVEPKLRLGGALIVDNALWHGRVLTDADASASAAGVRELTRRLVGDRGWVTTLLPIRDGLLLALRVG